MEIANGFSELNDPEDKRRRFEGQLKERERGRRKKPTRWTKTTSARCRTAMPPAGGVGIGVDRLAMLLTDSHTIRDVILFPLLRPRKALSRGDHRERGGNYWRQSPLRSCHPERSNCCAK